MRALGLVVLAYALSAQDGPLRIHLPGREHDLGQIILWPGEHSRLEVSLRMRMGIREVQYRPRPVQGDPNDCTGPDGEDFPREHMPLLVLARPDMHARGGWPIPGQPVALHLAGTSPSHVWLGKFLLNLSLDESNSGNTQLYNLTPAESLAPGSAELSLTIPDPADAPAAGPRDG